MNTYNVDRYSFSNDWIEGNNYLNREEKDIMLGLNRGSQVPAVAHTYKGKITEDLYGRRTLTKTPVEYDFDANLNDRRWYEGINTFVERKKREFVKANTKKVKEIKREKLNLERSTFEDGTQITVWDKDVKYFL